VNHDSSDGPSARKQNDFSDSDDASRPKIVDTRDDDVAPSKATRALTSSDEDDKSRPKNRNKFSEDGDEEKPPVRKVSAWKDSSDDEAPPVRKLKGRGSSDDEKASPPKKAQPVRPTGPVKRPSAWGAFPCPRPAAPDDSEKLRALNGQYSLDAILDKIKQTK
jgi:hypothetical protein